MLIKIQQQILNNALSNLIKVISNKSTLPILSCFYISADDTGIKIISGDSISYLEININAFVQNPTKIAVPAKILTDIVRKMQSDEITLDYNNNVLNVSSNKVKFDINCMNADEYPLLHEEKSNKTFEIKKTLLKDMIDHSAFATSKDEMRKTLQGVKFEIEDNDITFVALDLFRVAIIKKKLEGENTGNFNAIVPSNALNDVVKVMGYSTEEDISIRFGDNNIIFETNSFKYTSRLIEGEFLNYKKVIPTAFKTTAKLKTEQLYQAVDRVSLMSMEDNKNSIIFEFKDDYMEIYSQASKGSAKETIKNSLEGVDVKIGFNPNYIMDGLKVIDGEELEIKMIDSLNPCIIKELGNDDFQYMVLPVRI